MNQRGFTLVEIIIALTILSMLFIVISYIQARGAASYAATSQSVEVQESLRIALNKMSRELNRSVFGRWSLGVSRWKKDGWAEGAMCRGMF
jgi:prepilin-type N-terminal cleavage/methylation domain-containing protein